MGIYVETQIRGTMSELWRLTQTPDQHVSWDIRFTDIEYLPRPDENQPQQFLYATRIGFGLVVRGNGETVGQRDMPSGECTSALKFWSDDPKSLIREGAGYWRYIPGDDRIRFLTDYDYRVRFGALGKTFDAFVFRPLIAWATAWSFDRLRLWIEKGIAPAVSMKYSLLYALTRVSIAFVWVYQGAVPKILTQHADELALVRESGFAAATAPLVVHAVGWFEVLLGIATVIFFHKRWPLIVTIALMVGAIFSVAISSPSYLAGAFNPVTLNVLMIAMALAGLLIIRDVPSARRCLRKPPQECQ